MFGSSAPALYKIQGGSLGPQSMSAAQTLHPPPPVLQGV